MVNEHKSAPGSVFQDKNLLSHAQGIPVPLLPEAKRRLISALHNDTKFLARQTIVDYSILVAVVRRTTKPEKVDAGGLRLSEDQGGLIVVGIIDYLQP